MLTILTGMRWNLFCGFDLHSFIARDSKRKVFLSEFKK
jgi:hypothetical protein